MKIYLTILLAFIGLSHLSYAKQLPEDAKRILDKLAEYEERELKATEEEIVKNKKAVIKTLERSERRIKTEGMRKLYAWQINNLKSEVAQSEKIISGGGAQKIVDYDVIYHYDHPIEAYSDQKGELIFYRNSKVSMRHRNPGGKIVFSQDITWELRDGQLFILDQIHGEMIVTQKMLNNSNELSVEWTRLGKTITAKVK
jgi:hypothetical protein